MNWLMKMLGKSKRGKAGFTLVELMIVVIIVGILAAAAVPIYTAFRKKAYESEARASLGAIKTAELVYYAETDGSYTGDWVALGITSADFALNKWFDGPCFYLAGTSDDWTAYCDGSKGKDSSTVGDIQITFDKTGEFGTFTGEPPGTVCP